VVTSPLPFKPYEYVAASQTIYHPPFANERPVRASHFAFPKFTRLSSSACVSSPRIPTLHVPNREEPFRPAHSTTTQPASAKASPNTLKEAAKEIKKKIVKCKTVKLRSKHGLIDVYECEGHASYMDEHHFAAPGSIEEKTNLLKEKLKKELVKCRTDTFRPKQGFIDVYECQGLDGFIDEHDFEPPPGPDLVAYKNCVKGCRGQYFHDCSYCLLSPIPDVLNGEVQWEGRMRPPDLQAFP